MTQVVTEKDIKKISEAMQLFHKDVAKLVAKYQRVCNLPISINVDLSIQYIEAEPLMPSLQGKVTNRWSNKQYSMLKSEN